jgi:hypothetical protein
MQPQHFPDFAHGQPDICHSALPTKPSIVPPLTRVAATPKSCSRWRGNPVLFAVESALTLPWNSCSFSRGIPVHFAVEYSGRRFATVPGGRKLMRVDPGTLGIRFSEVSYLQ